MIFLILILALGVRLINLNQSLWLDEAAQVIESARPLTEQLNIRGDFWPPLYHLLLHFWMRFDTGEIWLRLLSVGLGIGSIWITYLLARKLANKKVALLTSLFLAVAPFHVWYSQEVRPYMLSVFLGVLASYFLVKRKFIWYMVAVALFLYSSYLAVFLLCIHGVYILVFERKMIGEWVKSVFIGSLFFLPWLPEFLQQLRIGRSLTVSLPGWSEAVSTPLAKALPLTFTKFILGRITIDDQFVYALLILFLFGLTMFLAWQTYKRYRRISAKLILLTASPILLAFLVSFVVPILAPQRVLFVLPFFYFFLALGTHAILNRKLSIIAAVVILISSLYSLFLYTQPRFQREQWRQAVHFVETTATKDSLVIFVFPDEFAPWQWYSHDQVETKSIAPEFVVTEINLHAIQADLLQANRIYYFHYLTDLTDPVERTQTYIKNLGFREVRTVDFPGVGFISIYEKSVAFY